MRSVVRTACIFAILGISPVYAADYISAHIPEAKLVGQGRAQILWWDVYDARLYAPGGTYAEKKPFALELNYLQEIDGRQIADHSVSEMRRLGYKNEIRLASWHDRMSRIFPDVVPGSTVTGLYIPGGPTIFYADEKKIGQIEDPEFGKEFFRIWLDARTSTPDLRKNLLNLDKTTKGSRHDLPAKNSDAGGNHVS